MIAREGENRARPSGTGKEQAMAYPIPPPVEPMLAKASDALPSGDGWLFEPK